MDIQQATYLKDTKLFNERSHQPDLGLKQRSPQKGGDFNREIPSKRPTNSTCPARRAVYTERQKATRRKEAKEVQRVESRSAQKFRPITARAELLPSSFNEAGVRLSSCNSLQLTGFTCLRMAEWAKRRRLNPQSEEINRWNGFCEIESEPVS